MSEEKPSARGKDSTQPTGSSSSSSEGKSSGDPFLSVFGDAQTDRTIVAPTLELPVEPSRPIEELARDKLIRDAPRARVQNVIVPCLGGIPLLSKLGQGGMGAVYYGIQPRLGQEVAVKVLPFHLADQNPDMIQRFYREARIAVGIQSPNLVRILDVNEENGLIFMVMEYVNGSSAGVYMKSLRSQKRVLNERPALELSLAAARGLAVAHGHGVVHRDIKPDNILIPWDQECGRPRLTEAKLADLGLARSVETHGESLTASAAALGTPGYMSPEQGMDAKKASRPADIFSLGATLYAFLCGHAPFRATSVVLTLLDTAQRPHVPVREFREDVSEATNTLINRCLAKDPKARFQDAAALLLELEKCCAALKEPEELTVVIDLPESAPVSPSATQSVPGSRSRPLPGATPTGLPSQGKPSRGKTGVLLLIGLAALVVGAVSVAVWPRDTGPEPEPIRIADQRKPPATPTSAPTKPEPAPEPEPDPKEVAVAKARKQLTAAIPIAANHKLVGEWEQVVNTLRPVMDELGDADHPNKRSAETLLAEAERKLRIKAEYAQQVERLQQQLAAGELAAAEATLAAITAKYPTHAGDKRLTEAANKIEAQRQQETFEEAVQRGKACAAKGQWQQAVAAYQKALATKKDDAPTQELLAAAEYQLLLRAAQGHLAEENWLEAESAFEKLAKHPKAAGDQAASDGLAQAKRGRSLASIKGLLDKQEQAAALLAVEQYLKRHPDDGEASRLRSRAQVELAMYAAIAARNDSNWPTARTEFEKVLKIDPDHDLALAGVKEIHALEAGRAALEKNEFDVAEKAFNEALEARADSAAAKKGLADVAQKRAERQNAINAAQSAYAKALAEGRRALAARQWTAAEQAFERALAVRPLDVEARGGVKAAQAGRTVEHQFRTALQAAQQALQAGNLNAAEGQFRAAERLQPGSVEVQAGLRRVKDLRRQQDAAKKADERPPRPRPRPNRDDEDDSVY